MTVFYSVIEPFHRFLPANDPDVAYPHIDTIVPTWALVLGSLGIPILAFLLYQVRIQTEVHTDPNDATRTCMHPHWPAQPPSS